MTLIDAMIARVAAFPSKAKNSESRFRRQFGYVIDELMSSFTALRHSIGKNKKTIFLMKRSSDLIKFYQLTGSFESPMKRFRLLR